MKLRAIFAANVRRRRKEMGFSQEELSDLAQVDRTYVSMLERERYAVSIDVLERIADALALPAAELLVDQSSNASLLKQTQADRTT